VGNFVDTLGRVFTRQVINGVANYVLSSAINGYSGRYPCVSCMSDNH
jgi:hypothetical protein